MIISRWAKKAGALAFRISGHDQTLIRDLSFFLFLLVASALNAELGSNNQAFVFLLFKFLAAKFN